jgi:aspartyl/asparaginyl beta-hydroxylase (cupin superfamily)
VVVKAFYDLSEFPELQKLTENHAAVREDLQGNELWLNWASDSYDAQGNCLFLAGDWKICPVYFGRFNPYDMIPSTMDKGVVDQLLASLPRRFPRTVSLLSEIPNIKFAGFSRLKPKTNLVPHRHNNPHSVVYHLGVVIPPGGTCGLMVDGQTHIWSKAGDAVIFYDGFEHSAWNDSDEERIVLYADLIVSEEPAS